MKTLNRISIHEVDLSTQYLSRERMRAIKGGGGNCYLYCGNGGTSSMQIVSSCSSSSCGSLQYIDCYCY